MCSCHSIQECCVTFSGVKLSIRSFVLFIIIYLIDCSSNWLVNIDRGGINTTVLLDIKKAFDTIDHETLLTKLDYYEIKNDELHFLKS